MSATPIRRPRRLLLAALLLAAPLALVSASSAVTVSLTPVKADPDINEYLPSASGDWYAWTTNSAERPPAAFVQQTGQARQRLNPRGTYGETGGFDGDRFVWTQWSKGSAGDIWHIDLASHDRGEFAPAVNTEYGEFYPTVSGTWLLFTRYNWDTRRYRVILFNTSNGNKRVLASGTPGNGVYSGQVNGDFVTYGRYSTDTSAVFRYQISTRTTVKVPNATSPQAYDPGIASDGTVYFVRSDNSCGADVDLVRYPVGGPAEKVRDLGPGVDTYRTYVDDRAAGSREVHLGRRACGRNHNRWLDTYKYVDTYQLTVATSGDGTGTVTSNPAGINCGSDCTEVFTRGTTVTLTATPGLGSEVSGWSVPECGVQTQCVVDVTANKTVTVTFGSVVP